MAAVAMGSDGQKSLYSVRRTQAVPDHTLFGTALEITGGSLPDLDLKKQERRRTPNTPLGRTVHRKREDVAHQKHIARQTQKALNSVQNKALSFHPEPRTIFHESRAAGSPCSHVDKSHQWLTRKDLEHSHQVNIVGLSKSGSYNRDKYGQHLRGNTQVVSVLQPHMNYTSHSDENCNMNADFDTTPILLTNNTNGDGDLGSGVDKPRYKSAIDLPPNIRHLFGTMICDEVLVDKSKVEDTITQLQRRPLPAHRLLKMRAPEITFRKGTNQGYINLSNTQRQNVLPGCPTIYTNGVTKTVHNDWVFKHRHPVPTEFRYHKDQHYLWWESDVVHKILGKHWEEYLSNRPKFTANWDRDAKRLTAIETPKTNAKPKPKPKPKKKPETTEANSVTGFESVTFITPPITPPPAPLLPEAKLEKFEKDDAFWEFYNQEVAS